MSAELFEAFEKWLAASRGAKAATKLSLKPAYLERADTAAFVALSVSTMERMVAMGEFPAPRKISDKRVGWLVRELEEWSESRPTSANLPVENCSHRGA